MDKRDSAPSALFSYSIPTLDTADMLKYDNEKFFDWESRNDGTFNYDWNVPMLVWPKLEETRRLFLAG